MMGQFEDGRHWLMERHGMTRRIWQAAWVGLMVGWGPVGRIQAGPPDELLTVAERSNFQATARHAEVVTLCERLAARSPLVHLTEFGKSAEGRSLPLLVVADPPIRTPAEARASGKLVVFLMGNIHAGEVCGKEALPILVREITDQPDPPLLNDLILLVAPIYNADGNERVSKTNRPGQVGPAEGMGQRGNAAGLDLNRDFMKLEAPETRALVRLLTAWDPALTVDTHTTNGSHHRYTLTYDGPKNPAGDARIIAFERTDLFPALTAAFKARSGRDAFFYGNFVPDPARTFLNGQELDFTRWSTYPCTPRFGTTYLGLRNRLSILTEAYSYAPYDVRVWATRDFCQLACEYVANQREPIRALLADARQATVIGQPRQVVIAARPRVLPEKVDVLGYVEHKSERRSVASDRPKTYLCAVEGGFEPIVTVPRPTSYLVPADLARVVDLLQAHGIELKRLETAERRDVTIDRVDQIQVTPPQSSPRYAGDNPVAITATTARTETRTIPAGTWLVPTAQPLGSLAVYLLEPRSDDGVATWDLLGDKVAGGQDFPILKLYEDH